MCRLIHSAQPLLYAGTPLYYHTCIGTRVGVLYRVLVFVSTTVTPQSSAAGGGATTTTLNPSSSSGPSLYVCCNYDSCWHVNIEILCSYTPTR